MAGKGSYNTTVQIAVVGAGVAGSFLADRLSRAGLATLVFEKKLSREKPCGGGCTPKILHHYPFLQEAGLPCNEIRCIRYESSSQKGVKLELAEPIRIYSRRKLDGYLLKRALNSGARLVDARAVSFRASSQAGWEITCQDGRTFQADVLVGADGATSQVRKHLGVHFGPKDLSLTLGYYIPGRYHPDTLYIRFLDPHLLGYLWSFPRVDHLSLGLINAYRQLPSRRLRRHLEEFARDLYGLEDPGRFPSYSAPVPTLRASTLRRLRVSGSNWALIGDAAGFVDPITAEGIYYAMRSADLLAEALLAGDLPSYEEAWRKDFGWDLLQAARFKDFFYTRRFMRDTFINRMLQLTRYSPTLRQAQNELISGREDYRSLKGKLLRGLPRVLVEALTIRWQGSPPLAAP